MANQLDNFDELIKNSLEGYEAPFNPAHWEEIENELNLSSPTFNSYFTAVTAGLIATGLIFMTMLFLLSDADQKNTALSSVATPAPIVKQGTTDPNQSLSNVQMIGVSDQAKILVGKDSVMNNLKVGARVHTNDPIIKPGKTNASHTVSTNNVSKTGVADSGNNGESEVRKGCTGLVIDFNAADEYGRDAKFLWNFGDGFFSNDANPSHTFKKEGTFDVSLSVTSPSSGQIKSNIVQAMIKIVEAPVAGFAIDIINPRQIKLTNASQNATEGIWSVNTEVVKDKSQIILSMADNAKYAIGLRASNDNGCADSFDQEIVIASANNTYQSALNVNDRNVFSPMSSTSQGHCVGLKIFDDRENVIFNGTGQKGWNGLLPSGGRAVPGNYSWVMIVEENETTTLTKGQLKVR